MRGGGIGYLPLLVVGLLRPGISGFGISIGSGAALQDGSVKARLLQPGEVVRGKLTTSEGRFEVELRAGMFLRFAILTEAPAQVELTGPGGRVLAGLRLAADSEVPISTIGASTGRYALIVKPAEAGLTDVAYRLRLREVRPARPDDSSRLRADQLVRQASGSASSTSPDAGKTAFQTLEAARRLYQEVQDSADSVDVLIRSGRLRLRLEDFAKAAATLETAIGLSREMGNSSLEAAALSAASSVYTFQGKEAEAAEASRTSLRLAREAGDDWLEARSLVASGDAQYSNAQMNEALNSYLRAAELWTRLEWRRGQAEALLNVGYTRMDLGEEKSALAALTRAEALWRALGDKPNTAETLRALGGLHSKLDDKQKALDYYLQAQALLPATGERRQRALLSSAIGWIYFDLGEMALAGRYFREALDLARAIGYAEAEGAYLHQLGLVSFAGREYARAKKYYEASLTIFRKLGNRRWTSLLALEIGTVLLAEGQTAAALESLNEALKSIREHTGPYTEAKCLEAIGRAYQISGNYERASQSYTEALSLLQAGSYRYREAQIRLQLARLERDRGNLDAAYKQSASAVEILESVRLSVPGPEFRASYFSSTHEYFEFHTDLLMRLHRVKPAESLDAVAFQVTERGRARSLLDRLAEAQVKIREGVDPGLLERETDLKRRLNRAAARQADLPANAKAALESAAKEIQDLNNEYQQVEALIRTRSPKYAALMQPEPLTLAQVQRELLDRDTVLLEYALGEECSYLWAVSADSYRTFRLPGRSAIEKSALRLRALLTAHETSPGGTTRERRLRIREAESRYWTEAAALSEVLLGPVAAIIANKRLLIVTDGALDSLPFAALPVPKRSTAGAGVPLVVEHELVRLPSASSLGVLRSQNAGRKKPGKWLAVVADPVFEADDPRMPRQPQNPVASSPARGSGPAGPESNIVYRRLPATRGEAEAITKLVPAGEATTALGFAANRGFVVNADLKEYRIVHFATHITAHYAQPELSGVALSKFDRAGAPQEGLLRLHDIYNLRLPVELVVLSGCESYLGKQVRGEGLLGIVRGFMYAGSNRVIASLWKVDDLATKELMERFYRSMLGKGEAPAAALRNAQVEMWQQPDWRSPYYWAAFLLQGEWR